MSDYERFSLPADFYDDPAARGEADGPCMFPIYDWSGQPSPCSLEASHDGECEA